MRNQTLPGPDQATLDKWDKLGQSRRVAGIGGSDAHAFYAKLGPLQFCYFPYEMIFRAVNTHVLLPETLTGNFDQDKNMVHSALAEGSCFVSHDCLHPGRGFDFWLENNGQRRAGQGQETILEHGDALIWRLPARAVVRLIKDGDVILSQRSKDGQVRVNEPGVYRLEAFRPGLFFGPRPWIFSNHVYVRPPR